MPQCTICNFTHLLAFQIHDHQLATILDESQFLTIRRECRIAAFNLAWRKQYFFFNQGSIREVWIVLAFDLCQIKFPVSTSFAWISQCAVVWCKRQALFSSRSVGNLLGSSIVYWSNEYFTTIDESNLLTVRWYSSRTGTTYFEFSNLFAIITSDFNSQFLCFAVSSLCIDFTIISIAKCSFIAYWKEAYRMSFEACYRLDFFRIVEVERIYIHATTLAFAQEIYSLSVRSQWWIAVFSTDVGQVGVLSALGVIQPDVASNGRCVVLAPFVFKTLTVLVEEWFAILYIANRFGRSSNDLLGTTTFYRYLIKFRHSRSREESTLSWILDRSREHYMLSIRCERRRHFRNRKFSQFLGASTICRHDIDVEITIAVTGKSNLLAVWRPDRCTLIRILGSELLGCSTLRIYGINITFVTERYSASIRGNLHITHPQRSNCLACKCCQAKGHTGE